MISDQNPQYVYYGAPVGFWYLTIGFQQPGMPSPERTPVLAWAHKLGRPDSALIALTKNGLLHDPTTAGMVGTAIERPDGTVRDSGGREFPDKWKWQNAIWFAKSARDAVIEHTKASKKSQAERRGMQ